MEGIEELEEVETPKSEKSPPAKSAGKTNAQRIKETEEWIMTEIKKKNDLDERVKKAKQEVVRLEAENKIKKEQSNKRLVEYKVKVYDLQHNDNK